METPAHKVGIAGAGSHPDGLGLEKKHKSNHRGGREREREREEYLGGERGDGSGSDSS